MTLSKNQKRLFFWLAGFLTLLSCTPLSGTLSLQPQNRACTPTTSLRYLEDKSGNLTITNLLATNASAFRTAPTDAPNFGFSRSAWWIRIPVQNSSSNTASWFLEYQYPFIDDISFFIVKKGVISGFPLSGRNHPFRSRRIKNRHFAFPFTLKGNEEATLYLRLKSGSNIPVPIVFYTPEAFYASDHESQLILGLFYGSILILVIYNLLLLFSFKDITYLFYILFLISISIVQMGLHGIAYEYLWPNAIWWNNHSFLFFTAISVFWACIFLRSFLFTRTRHPRLHKMLKIQEALLLCSALSFFILDYGSGVKIVSILAILSFIMIIGTSIRSLTTGFHAARYYLLAWSLFLFGGLSLVLRNFGVLPHNFFTMNGMQIGMSFLAIFLSLALSDRIIHLRKEHEKLSNIEKELTIARAVQSSILTSTEYIENISSLEIDIQFLPMRHDVSGDYFNVMLSQENSVSVTIADASGHGLQAALTTMQIDMLYKESLALRLPDERLAFINNLWFRKIKGYNFFTCFTMELQGGRLHYACGGHPVQYLIRPGESKPDTQLIPLKTRGPLIGVSAVPVFETRTQKTRSGDILLLFSDGLFEEFNKLDEEYGEERLEACIRKMIQNGLPEMSTRKINHTLIQDVTQFRAGMPLNDDITVMAIRIK